LWRPFAGLAGVSHGKAAESSDKRSDSDACGFFRCADPMTERWKKKVEGGKKIALTRIEQSWRTAK
jgi:hypothetical protein